MKKQKWRFIYTGYNGPYFNMAVDEVLLNSAQNGAIATLRIYEWNPATISIGYFQGVRKTVDLSKCRRAGVKLVRRMTGGRAVLHDKELTYSFCGSPDDLPVLGRNILETYKKISSALIFSLIALGIKAECIRPRKENESSRKVFYRLPCFSSFSRYEISVQGKKLIGSAQRRVENSFLQHGSILLQRGTLKLVDFLPGEFHSEKNKIDESSTYIEKIIGEKINKFKILNSIKSGFSEYFQRDFEEDFLTSKELKKALKLKEKKYANDNWNLKF